MKKLLLIPLMFVLASCAPSADSVKKVIAENPDVVFEAIKENPGKFFKTIEEARQNYSQVAQEEAQKQEKERIDEEFKNPKKPDFDTKRAIFGNPNAPIKIVEYSDFQCPYCSRAYETLQEVKKEYGDKVAVLYKHLPLPNHPLAMPAAEYYEAIALQDSSKAEKFHDMIFQDQRSLNSEREEFLKSAAKKVGANMAQLNKDLKSDKVKERIEADMAEARKFGFSGTPGFLINGVSLPGAYPMPIFKEIIDRHLDNTNP